MNKIIKFLKISALLFILLTISGIVFTRLRYLHKKTPYNVYVAFGFHVNLYHSFRHDTNDEAGYGLDIRVLRHLVYTLDAYNLKGIPVKAVWDFDNYYSLEKVLPKEAPDIIEHIKRRVRNNGDEIILMSYNNAMASCLTKDEFRDAVQHAITNQQQSGVKDIFKKWSPLVRPQEMMVTPGNYALYKKNGIDTLVLYYSNVPFDAFRMFTPPLTREEAHNPLTYHNRETGDNITVLPAYNIGDLVENVSLKTWVRRLHNKQLSGEIKNDVLLFINFDGDSKYWIGPDWPLYLRWIPNTGGIDGLLRSISGLEYVRYTTLQDYLDNHPPLKTVSFGQDLADGSYNGYNSWAEKATSHEYWSSVVKNRRQEDKINKLYASIQRPIPAALSQKITELKKLRMELLSSTNYGMATPFLARGREDAVREIIQNSQAIITKTNKEIQKAIQYTFPRSHPDIPGYAYADTFLLPAPDANRRFHTLAVTLPKNAIDKELYVVSSTGEHVVPHVLSYRNNNHLTVQAHCLFNAGQLKKGTYHIYISDRQKSIPRSITRTISNRDLELTFSSKGMPDNIIYKNKKIIDPDSLLPVIKYNNNTITPKDLLVTVTKDTNNLARVRINGTLPMHGPQVIKNGSFDYRFTLVDNLPCLFLDARIQYPETKRGHFIKKNLPSLTRKADLDWQAVMPAQIRFTPHATAGKPFTVIKRNFLNVKSGYTIDYFRYHSDNNELTSINNHLTPEYFALEGKHRGIAVAMDTSLLSNFAFCPVSIRRRKNRFYAQLNPFGTYHGKQPAHPTSGNGNGQETTLLLGEQYNSSAPTYNGKEFHFGLMLAFFDQNGFNETLESDLSSYAGPQYIVQQKYTEPGVTGETHVNTPRGFLAAYGKNPATNQWGVYFNWDPPRGNPKEIIIQCGEQSGQYDTIYYAEGSKTSLFVPFFKDAAPFQTDKRYFAKARAVSRYDKISPLTDEISFVPKEKPQYENDPFMPIPLRIKIAWDLITAFLFE